MELTYQEYFKRLMGCFIGKSVGGTLGMPYEGEERLLNLTYYDPVPDKMVANDDLDLQVMFLESVLRNGLPVHREYLSRTWLESLRFVCDEYGVAQKNLRIGLRPPVTGYYDNKFYAGLGAAIRTELWACLAPGDPDLAAALVREDASIDHYNDGVEAAVFLAVLESAAFLNQNIRELLQLGLSYLNPEGRLYEVLTATISWWDEERDFVRVRQLVLDKYYVQNWTDVSLNLAFIVVGLLDGAGDFSRSLCTAVNCGNDADCTGATIGALLGILNPDGIEERWTRPIGNQLVLGVNMVGMHEVETIDEMCVQIASLSKHVQEFYHSAVRTIGFPEFPAYARECAKPWKKSGDDILLTQNPPTHESVIARVPLYTTVVYPEKVSLAQGETAEYTLRFQDPTNDDMMKYCVELHLPHGFIVEPATFDVVVAGMQAAEVKVSITAVRTHKNAYLNPLDICVRGEKTIVNMTAGIPTAMSWYRKAISSPTVGCPKIADFTDAKLIHAHSHFQTVPEGCHILTLEAKEPISSNNTFLVAEGTRPMRVWIDDKEVLCTDGSYYVPAFHRGPWRGRVDWRGWQRITVEVGDGPEGEIFLAFATPNGFEWLHELEYRLPVIERKERTNQ